MSRLFIDIQTELPQRIGDIVRAESRLIVDRTARITFNHERMRELWDIINGTYVNLLDRVVITN